MEETPKQHGTQSAPEEDGPSSEFAQVLKRLGNAIPQSGFPAQQNCSAPCEASTSGHRWKAHYPLVNSECRRFAKESVMPQT